MTSLCPDFLINNLSRATVTTATKTAQPVNINKISIVDFHLSHTRVCFSLQLTSVPGKSVSVIALDLSPPFAKLRAL
jgi:hypothetical protein